MNTFRKYFFKEFFKFFTLILLGLTALSVVAEFFDKASEFYAKGAPIAAVVQYLLLQTPRVLLYCLPFASLFSILIIIGIASKWRETIVIKASGTSTKRVFSGFLIMGVLISFFALLFGETVVPAATSKAAWIRKVKILKVAPRIEHREEALWIKGLDKSLIRIAGFLEEGNRLLRTSIFSFNSSFGLEKRIEADEAVWVNGAWELKNVTVFHFNNDIINKHDALMFSALEEPKIFRDEMKKPKEMNFTELYAYYSRLEKAGIKNLKYLVRLYEKLAYPTINFVMILFGLSLALHSTWGGGIKAAGLGVIVSAVYWLIYAISISLGNTGTLPPWIAPWIGPVLFGIAGGIMYLKIKE